MKKDYLPGKDSDFQAWIRQFAHMAATHQERLELSDDTVKKLASVSVGFSDAMQALYTARAMTAGATIGKDTARAEAAAFVRQTVRYIQSRPSTTDDLRSLLKITTEQKPQRSLPPSVPFSLTVTLGQNGGHDLRWRPGDSKPGTTYQVQVRFGTAPQWYILNTTAYTKFAYTPEKPGAAVAYRIVASRAGMLSQPCHEVALYVAPPETKQRKAA